MAETVGAHILDRLHGHGIGLIYGYPGDGISGIMGALGRAADRMRVIQSSRRTT